MFLSLEQITDNIHPSEIKQIRQVKFYDGISDSVVFPLELSL
jgi:hypothetical protein